MKKNNNALVLKISSQLSTFQKEMFLENVKYGTKLEFDFSTKEGILEYYNNKETISCIYEYAYNIKACINAVAKIKEILNNIKIK